MLDIQEEFFKLGNYARSGQTKQIKEFLNDGKRLERALKEDWLILFVLMEHAAKNGHADFLKAIISSDAFKEQLGNQELTYKKDKIYGINILEYMGSILKLAINANLKECVETILNDDGIRRKLADESPELLYDIAAESLNHNRRYILNLLFSFPDIKDAIKLQSLDKVKINHALDTALIRSEQSSQNKAPELVGTVTGIENNIKK